MKKIALILCFLPLLKAGAVAIGLDKADSVCARSLISDGRFTTIKKSIVYHDSDYLIMGLAARSQSELTFISQIDGSSKEIILSDHLIDFTTSTDSIYALGKSKVYKLRKNDLRLTHQMPTLDERSDFSRYSDATGISYYNGELYISHGSLGVVVRDGNSLTQKSHTRLPLTSSHDLHRATLTDIDVKAGQVLLGVDNITGSSDGSRGLEGYYLAQTNQLAQAVFKSIDARREALDNPQVFLDGQQFFGLNWFYLFRYQLADFQTRQPLNPDYRFWQTEPKGMLMGRASIDEEYIYSCSKTPDNKGIFVALERARYQL